MDDFVLPISTSTLLTPTRSQSLLFACLKTFVLRLLPFPLFCTAHPAALVHICRSPPISLHVLRLPVYPHTPPTLD
jgi:hypothetical protein